MARMVARVGWPALLAGSLCFQLPECVHAQMSSGTAFAVTEDGDVITNEHVVSGCTSVDARLGSRQTSGEVVFRDQNDDLAVIRLSEKSPHFAVLRKSPALRAGDSAITYGFPLSGILANEGNLTIGYVAALRGPADNPNYVQVTTPIQPGNSGGPLLDASGNVIGVVAKRLNPVKSLQITGNVPELVNFAIGLDALRQFLNKSKIRVSERDSVEELRPADIGEKARLFTYSIRCLRNSTALTTAPPAAVRPSPQPSADAGVAALYEEDTANAYGRRYAGSIAWRVETVPAEGVRLSTTTVRGDIQVPGHIDAVLTMRGGTDAPTGHTIEITFNPTTDVPHRAIASMPGILMKLSEQTQGIPFAARTMQTTAGSFLVELSGLEGYRQRNVKLLRERAWFDVPIVYKDGRRAILSLEKGVSGARVFDEALADWGDAAITPGAR